MLDALKHKLIELGLTPEDHERIRAASVHVNSAGYDDWGMDPETLKATLPIFRWIYRDYFRVETTGIEKLPQGRVLVVANHGGQLPLDGLIVGLSLFMDGKPPRIARGMVERFFPLLPFVSTFFMRVGQMVGDHRNCRDLLEHDEAVLVFPEGVKGSGKLIQDRYKLADFGTGFVRLALETKTPVVPVAVIGCEETYPGIANFSWLAKKFGLPYFPITPFFPLLGPLGAVPLPTKVTLRYCDPIFFEGDPDMPEADVVKMVERVKSAIRKELEIGLEKRGSDLFTKAAV